MENRMNVHGRRKIKSERGSAKWTNDRERTKTTNIQLGGRTSCGDVASEEPHFMARYKCGGRTTTTIGGGLHGLSSFEEFLLKDNLGLLQLYDVRIRGRCR